MRCYIITHIPPVASVAGREAALWAAFAYLEVGIRTNVYIDGFNFYYGALRKTPYLVVDAKDEQAAAFYEHLGFRRFVSRPMSLYLPIATAISAMQTATSRQH